MDFLKEFIKQTQTGSLKTKDYPKEYLDLKMKVSFGQGSLSRIPWRELMEITIEPCADLDQTVALYR